MLTRSIVPGSTALLVLLLAAAASATPQLLEVLADQPGIGQIALSIEYDDATLPTASGERFSIHLAGRPSATLSVDGILAPVFCCEIEVYDGYAPFFGGADGVTFRFASDEALTPDDFIELTLVDLSGSVFSGPSLGDLVPFPPLAAWDIATLGGGPAAGVQLDASITSITIRDPATPIPEPGAALLFAMGAFVSMIAVRR